jgi:hypothetical protein
MTNFVINAIPFLVALSMGFGLGGLQGLALRSSNSNFLNLTLGSALSGIASAILTIMILPESHGNWILFFLKWAILLTLYFVSFGLTQWAFLLAKLNSRKEKK